MLCLILGVPLHMFPNPVKEPVRFNLWLIHCGADFKGKTDEYIFKNRRICRRHFASNHLFPGNSLFNMAIPNLNLQHTSSSDGSPPLLDSGIEGALQ